MHATLPHLIESQFPPLKRAQLQTLQVNLGYLCNQSCLHCHVNAGPNRTELMDRTTMDMVLAYLRDEQIQTLDLTGGAPELNPDFCYLVTEARKLGVTVIDRCNLTVLEQPRQEGLAQFLADQQVQVVASLPCYLEENVDAQRGKGVFAESVRGLKQLNELGYGIDGSGLSLDLVYNPQGATLPPPQAALEADYKMFLWQKYGIRFNQLLTLTNLPIQRFGSLLISKGKFKQYMDLLKASYQVNNLASVMCRSLLSVDWQGFVYDCDFNQMLDLSIGDAQKKKWHLSDLQGENLYGREIQVADHCYGCTAGQGSSCGGALSE
ncbi:MAG: arsenosugar biosynthesis radical SAM protein ArsS [Gammaproteobacteria bacterium]|nr:arsenosugar biosynthesis radical SAM protein ArsS [Gammaproteobacteria bacterium]